jgi:hypothetical protein
LAEKFAELDRDQNGLLDLAEIGEEQRKSARGGNEISAEP